MDKCLTVVSNGTLIYSAVIDSIVTLSERLQIQLVAEGVENKEQLSLLKDKGVNVFRVIFFKTRQHARVLQTYLTPLPL